VDTDYFRIVFGVRNLLEVMDPHVWDMALAVTELTLGGTSMSTIVGDRSGRRSNSVPSSRRCVEGEAERITTAKKKRAALNLLRNGCGTEVGVCRVQEAAVGRALIAAVEVLRFRAVQWWERSKARVPRQVAGLIRYTEDSSGARSYKRILVEKRVAARKICAAAGPAPRRMHTRTQQ
jgi:hypothetical protein